MSSTSDTAKKSRSPAKPKRGSGKKKTGRVAAKKRGAQTHASKASPKAPTKKKAKGESRPPAAAAVLSVKVNEITRVDDPIVDYPVEYHFIPRGALDSKRLRSPKDRADCTKNQLKELFRFLFETRRLEEHLVALYRQTKVVGGVYRSLGQEATAVGCTYGLQETDIIQPLIRDLGAGLVHGVKPVAILRQYMARETGPTGGRDLNTHFSAPQHGILGPVSMLGAMIPVLAGCLLAARHQKKKVAGLAFIGDGGSSTGAFYEGLGFACVNNLPMIVVVQNNRYAYSTPTSSQLPDGDLIRRAKGFGAHVAHVDGNDVLACVEATREARARGLKGQGPTIIVADTYRRKGHAEHDNQDYVQDKEIAAWETENDPLDRFETFLLQGKHLKEAELETLRQEVETDLNLARDTAVSESFPGTEQLEAGVFADEAQPWPEPSTWIEKRAHHRADHFKSGKGR